MKTEMKIRRDILMSMVTEEQIDNCDWIDLSSDEGVMAAWEKAEEYDDIFSKTEIIDAESEFRCSGEDTNLPCEYSRDYEGDQVAKKLSCGASVSWTYWYGGGKWGEPSAIDWIDDAYEVLCTEEEKTVVVKTYSRIT